MPQPKRVRFFLILILAGLFAAPLAAEDFIAAGDRENLWIIRTKADGKSIVVSHRRVNDKPESRLQLASELTGTLIPGGAAAGEGFLWLFYANGSVQGLKAIDEPTGRRVTDIILPAMPPGVKVRSIAVTRTGAWALVRIEDAKLLHAIDHPDEPPDSWRDKKKQRLRPPELKDAATDGKTPPTPEPTSKPEPTKADDGKTKPDPTKAEPTKTDPAKAPAATDGPTDAPASVKADRLLHLGRLTWERIELPADWNPDLPAWLVTQSHDDQRPLLVTAINSEKTLRWHRWDKSDPKSDKPEEWLALSQTVASDVRLPPTVLNNKLTVVNRLNSPGRIELSVTMIRPERVSEVGTIGLEEGVAWSVTPLGDQLALVTVDKAGAIAMKRINERGAAEPNPTPMAIEPPSLGPVADVLVYVVVLAMVTPILILMWKRDATPLIPQLPRGLRLAEMAPRGIAALIDLVPCVVAGLVIRGVSLDEMFNYWPGRSGNWERMIPGAIAIGLFIGHTFLSELFTARTIGKAIIGLRVTGLKGEPPDLWQVLARNIFKLLDLILMPLLIFAILSPNRQRLGDVVARTLIVTRAAPDEQGPPGAEKKDEDDEKKRDLPPDPRPKRPK